MLGRPAISAVVAIAALVALGACGSDASNAPSGAANEPASDLSDVPCGNAYVDTVTIEEDGEGGHVAIVEGHYPAACDELGRVEQTVREDVVTITMCSTRPPDAVCAQQLTPFTETLPIETDALDSGSYTVFVNEAYADLTLP